MTGNTKYKGTLTQLRRRGLRRGGGRDGCRLRYHRLRHGGQRGQVLHRYRRQKPAQLLAHATYAAYTTNCAPAQPCAIETDILIVNTYEEQDGSVSKQNKTSINKKMKKFKIIKDTDCIKKNKKQILNKNLHVFNTDRL